MMKAAGNGWVLAPEDAAPARADQDSATDLGQVSDIFVTASRALIGVAVRAIEKAPLEVTLVQHRVLVLLEENGELSIGALAERLGVNQSSASRLCDRLERLQLVQRVPSDDDGRAVCVRITAGGSRVVADVHDLRQVEIRRILERLPRAEALRATRAVAAFARAAGEDPTHRGVRRPLPPDVAS